MRRLKQNTPSLTKVNVDEMVYGSKQLLKAGVIPME
jgi:hypothetical protein